MINPTIWTALLPIIISAGALTIGIPGYAITKNIKNSLEEATSKQPVNIEQATISTEKEKLEQKELTNTQVKNNETYLNPETKYVSTQQERNKVKTKGTIH